MIHRIFNASRYLIIIPVLGSFVSATTLLIYGALEVVHIVGNTIEEGTISSKGAKALALSFIEIVDLFLIATALYIIALGLYELFIDDTLPLPAWLEVHDLDDLKSKLISVIVVVMSVLFLGQIVTWDGDRDLLRFGASIALIIVSLTYFLNLKLKKPKESEGQNKN
jgi:uncharacterized membrane protein YqhA